jgi:hypothetical protein
MSSNISPSGQSELGGKGGVPKNTLPGARYEAEGGLLVKRRRKEQGNVRFPCIHKREPDSFQSANVRP